MSSKSSCTTALGWRSLVRSLLRQRHVSELRNEPEIRPRLSRLKAGLLSDDRSVPHVIPRYSGGHRVQAFDRGREAIDSMLEAIALARNHVHLETYIFRGDRTGQRLLAALEARAREGISVRVIFDSVGSRGLERGRLAPAIRSGVQFAEFNPPSRWFWRFRPRQRDHRKILIVDGNVGYLGGLNIGDEYVGEDADGPTWRDAHVRIEGPGLGELQALFLENWFRSGGESFDWRSLITHETESTGEHSLAIFADGPMYSRRRLLTLLLDEIQRSQSRILLVTPYFAPGPRMLDALANASDRGVRVEILLAGYTDHPFLRRAAHFLIPRLLHRGVRVFEDPDRMMHAKVAAFDDELALIGTSNLDRQSLQHSCEVNALFKGQEIAKWVFERFGPDTTDVKELDSATLAKRSTLSRWMDRFAAFWARI